jgi:pyruvate/2-oxoglutarate dehydrogenase complex dihydrolipoamide acyltransferase (E2) component
MESMATKDKTATPAAENKAEELGVSVTHVEGSGKDGSVTVADVEARASEAENTVEVKFNPVMFLSTYTTASGEKYKDGDPIKRDEYDRLKDSETIDGAPVFVEGGE